MHIGYLKNSGSSWNSISQFRCIPTKSLDFWQEFKNYLINALSLMLFVNPFYYSYFFLTIFLTDIINQSAVHFFLIHDDISLQFLIPTVSV